MININCLFLFPVDGVTFQKPDGNILTEDELFELNELLMKFLFENMQITGQITLDLHTKLPEKFIEMCSKFVQCSNSDYEDPVEYFNFLCALTKPKTNKLNENKERRLTPLDLCHTRTETHFECTKCNETWPSEQQNDIWINLFELLQKK